MTYDELSKATISRNEAIWLYQEHGCDADELDNDLGHHDTYHGQGVLDALGY